MDWGSVFCPSPRIQALYRVSRKLRPRKLRPQTSDPENSDPKNSDPKNSDPKNSDPENSDPENSDPENSDPENSDPENSDPPKLNKYILNFKKEVKFIFRRVALWSRNVHRQQPQWGEIFVFSSLSPSHRPNSKKQLFIFSGLSLSCRSNSDLKQQPTPFFFKLVFQAFFRLHK